MNYSYSKLIAVLVAIGLGFALLIPLAPTLRMEIEPVTHEVPHPYSQPITGAIFWEDDEEFMRIRQDNNLFIRMGAFQTTLPDPLPGEETNVAIAADYIAGTLVEPNTVFSVLKAIAPFTPQRGYCKGPTYGGTQILHTIGGGVCKISTTVYNVAVLANLPVVERYNHSMLVPYVPPGQDATVWYPNKDLKFLNNTDNTLMIWADTVGNTLYMAIYGRVTPPKVTWHHKITNKRDFPTYYRYNPKLKPGAQRVIIPGAEGLTVKSWITIQYNQEDIQTKNLSTDYYRPMPRVIERGRSN